MILETTIRDIKASMLDSIPTIYHSSQVLDDVFDAVVPELEEIFFAASAYDKSEANPNEKINREIDVIIAGAKDEIRPFEDIMIGWGHDKMIYQNFIISANRFLRNYARRYGVAYSDSEVNDYTEVRRHLLFRSRVKETLNERDMEREFDFVYPNTFVRMVVNHYIYHVDFVLSQGYDNVDDFIRARIRSTLPAHLSVDYVSESLLILSRIPTGTLSDGVDYTLPN